MDSDYFNCWKLNFFIMFDVFGSLQSYLKFDSVCIDNNVFRLHYKATVVIFACASLLVTSGQYIGDPIDCIVDGVPGGMMDTYCWIHSTFSIPNRYKNMISLKRNPSFFVCFFFVTFLLRNRGFLILQDCMGAPWQKKSAFKMIV